MFRIPYVIKNLGKQVEELTTKKPERWISATSWGDMEYKNVLQSERVLKLPLWIR